MAEGMAFDQLKPPLSVTDPEGAKHGLKEWPKHVHKAGVSHDGGPVYRVVENPDDEAAAVADGWHVTRAAALAEPDAAPPPAPPTRKR